MSLLEHAKPAPFPQRRGSGSGFSFLPAELLQTPRSKWVLDASRVQFFQVDDVASV